MLERTQGGAGGEIAAVDGEAQAITGHRIDETGGVAGKKQARDRSGSYVYSERAQNDWRGDQSRARESITQLDVVSERAGQECRGIRERATRGTERSDQTDIGQPARHRRDADVTVFAHMHFALNCAIRHRPDRYLLQT